MANNTINNGSAVIIGRISKCPFSILHSRGNGANLTHQAVATLTNRLNVDQTGGSCCDLVINLGHDDDNYYHIFNLHSSSPGDNNTLFVSSQVISQHKNKSVSDLLLDYYFKASYGVRSSSSLVSVSFPAPSFFSSPLPSHRFFAPRIFTKQSDSVKSIAILSKLTLAFLSSLILRSFIMLISSRVSSTPPLSFSATLSGVGSSVITWSGKCSSVMCDHDT